MTIKQNDIVKLKSGSEVYYLVNEVEGFQCKISEITQSDKIIKPVDFDTSLIEKVDTYFTYSIGGDEYVDCEFETREQAESGAEAEYQENCNEDDYYKNGDSDDEHLEIIRFAYNDDTGERDILEKHQSRVYYECYHGDYEEHNTRGLV